LREKKDIKGYSDNCQDLEARRFQNCHHFFTLFSSAAVSLAMPAVATTVEEWVVVCPAVFFVVASLYTIEEHKKFIDRGGKIKVITDFSYEYLESVQQHLDIGVDVRQLTGYRGIMFSVFDKKISTSAINVDIDCISLDTPVSMVWTDDSAYAAYLMSTFEMLWEQAIPATRRIEELLKEGTHRHNGW
jgi:hypothetical protein